MEKYPVTRQSERISTQVPIYEYFDQDSKNEYYFYFFPFM